MTSLAPFVSATLIRYGDVYDFMLNASTMTKCAGSTAIARRCQPSEEDFDITSLEAGASGRPVIAFGVQRGAGHRAARRNRMLFNERSADAVVPALTQCGDRDCDANRIRRQAEKFDSRVFPAKFLALTSSIRLSATAFMTCWVAANWPIQPQLFSGRGFMSLAILRPSMKTLGIGVE